jgi:hypothetical protein
MVMIGFLLITAVIGLIMAPKTRGKSLEQIQERYGSKLGNRNQARIKQTKINKKIKKKKTQKYVDFMYNETSY